MRFHAVLYMGNSVTEKHALSIVSLPSIFSVDPKEGGSGLICNFGIYQITQYHIPEDCNLNILL
jgi:hypothetical protein